MAKGKKNSPQTPVAPPVADTSTNVPTPIGFSGNPTSDLAGVSSGFQSGGLNLHPEGAFKFIGRPEDFGQIDPSSLDVSGAWMNFAPGTAYRGNSNWSWQQDATQAYYSEGDQYAPASWGPQAVFDIQSALDDAGLISGVYIKGAWDPKTSSAFEKVLAIANQLGITWQQALRMSLDAEAADKAAKGGLGAKGPTDDDIRALLNKTAQQILGRKLSDDEANNLISAFRGGYASGTEAGTIAENTIRGARPTEAGAHDVGNVMSVLANLIG